MAAELERKCERVRLGLDDPGLKQMPAEKFFSEYLETATANQADPDSIKWRFNKHIVPAFQGRLLSSIGEQDVQRLLAVKHRAGLSPRTVELIRGSLSGAFKTAIKWGVARKNPAAAVGRVRVPKKDPVFLNEEEIAKLLAVVPANRQCLVRVALATGLRKGELFGLLREDVDLQRQIIRVQRSYSTPYTKSKKARTVPIPDELLPHLRAHLDLMEEGERILFPNELGEVYSKKVEPAKWLRSWLEAAGITKYVVWHNLRATYATFSAEQIGARNTQSILGHVDFATTERYAAIRDGQLTEKGRSVRVLSPTDPAPTSAPQGPAGEKKS